LQTASQKAVLQIRIRIRMDPHDFGLLDQHPESAFQMRIPDNADSRCGCGSGISYVKIYPEILIINTIINV
jgi:hypothetical protein